ncbi:MAG: peptidoglycan-binding protein [Ignavibacteria bacterium]|nr:peptidoglycan-binding protein [Ignavibacteria bacterium]
MRTLKKGSRGSDVRKWQSFLIKQGFKPGGVDGDFGQNTHNATVAFQKKHGLESDGMVGKNTFSKAAELGYDYTLTKIITPTSEKDIDKLFDNIANHFCKVVVPSSDYFKNSICSNSDLLYPSIRNKAEKICKQVPNLHIFETYRSNVRQLSLFKQGFSKCSQFGMHYYGVAVDLVFKDGKGWTWDGDYKTVRQLYKENGLVVLGMWDLAHAQIPEVKQQTSLRNIVKQKIKYYQKKCGIAVDGDAGKNTQSAFRELFKYS